MLTRTPCRRRFLPRLELLEDRLAPAITTLFDDASKVLSVVSDAADAIQIAPVGGVVHVNGEPVQHGGNALPASLVQGVRVEGGPGPNAIDLSQITSETFTGLVPTFAVPLPGPPILVSIYATGGAGADNLDGSQVGDYLDGQGGIDTLRGNGGNDYLIGGSDDDDILGGVGNDYIDGDRAGGLGPDNPGAAEFGNDDIDGGDGNDNLNGNGGDDNIRADPDDGGGDGGPGDDQFEFDLGQFHDELVAMRQELEAGLAEAAQLQNKFLLRFGAGGGEAAFNNAEGFQFDNPLGPINLQLVLGNGAAHGVAVKPNPDQPDGLVIEVTSSSRQGAFVQEQLRGVALHVNDAAAAEVVGGDQDDRFFLAHFPKSGLVINGKGGNNILLDDGPIGDRLRLAYGAVDPTRFGEEFVLRRETTADEPAVYANIDRWDWNLQGKEVEVTFADVVDCIFEQRPIDPDFQHEFRLEILNVRARAPVPVPGFEPGVDVHQMNFRDAVTAQIIGKPGGDSTALIEPGRIPIETENMSVNLNPFGQQVVQSGNEYLVSGFAPVTVTNGSVDTEVGVGSDSVLKVTKTDHREEARLGELLSYEITIENTGTELLEITAVDAFKTQRLLGKEGPDGVPLFDFVEPKIDLKSLPTGVGVDSSNRFDFGGNVRPGFISEFTLSGGESRTLTFQVRVHTEGRLFNEVLVIGEHQGRPTEYAKAMDDTLVGLGFLDLFHGPVLYDVANNGMASQTSDGATSMGVGRAGANALFISDYTDIYPNAPGNTQPGHLAHGDPVMVDVAPDGTTPGNGFVSSFSSDDAGRFIAFASNATNLVAGITEGNSGSDIYFRDMARGTTILVSRNRDNPNQTPNRTSQLAVVSGNGKYVYFLSQATDLVTTPLNSTQPHLYRFNTATGVTELVNLNAAETGSGNRGVGFGISTTFDGELVAFESLASDLTADANVNDPNTEPDVFVRNMVTGVTDLVSHHHTNATTGNLGSNSPTISRNGAVITYVSRASDIVDLPDANNSHPFNKQDVFAYDVATKVNALVSINAAGTATGEQSSIAPRITPDARFVAFQSQARDLVTGFTGFGTQNNLVYVRDLVNDTTELISVDPSGTTVANRDAQGPSISDDGRFVAFISRATNLTTLADANNTFDAFVRDRLTDTTTILSVNLQGTAAGNGGTSQSLITADGQTVFFPNDAEDLASNDGNGKGNIFSSNDHLRFTFRAPTDGNLTNLLLRRNAADYEIVDADTSAILATRAALATDTIVVVGAANETETLTIDFTTGFFDLPQGIHFEGGSDGADRLTTVGSFTSVSYAPINATAGLLNFDGLSVGYSGLEAVADATSKENLAFQTSGANSTTRLGDDGTANNGLSQFDSNGTGTFLPHVFANPSAALIIQGGTGADTMLVAGVDAAFDAALVLSGGSGDDTLDASVFGRDVILRGGSGVNTLRGGGGNDTFVVTPDSLDVVGDGGGSDTLDFRNTFASITLNLDLQNVNQVVNQFGASLRLLGDFENVVGSAYSDTLFLAPAAFARQIQGHSQVIGVPGGDVLHFAAAATDDGATISTAGFADVTYADIEAVNLGSAPRDGGDVQVVLVNGKLTLTGDVKDNFVRLELGVTGAKTVRVTGLEGTRLNGQGGPLEFANVRKGVTAGLGDGNDRFELTGSQVAGAMKLDGGNGDDVYRLTTTKTIVKVVDTVGSDRLDFSGAAAGVKVNLASTLSQAVGSGNTLTLKGTVEQLVGSAFNDVLKGNTAANILLGLAGDDRLADKKGQNLLVGGTGRDTLTGGALEDILIGGRTVYDDEPHTLTNLMAEFLANGRANLEAGDDPRLVQGDTVLDDAVLDTLFADAADWTFS